MTKPLKPRAKHLSEVLGEVAVIASVQASALGMTRLDRRASTDSDRRHGARAGTAKVNVSRLPGAEDAINEIKAKQTRAHAILRGFTTQWGPDRRLLPNQNIGEFLGEIQTVIDEHDELRDDFIDRSVVYIANAKDNLGSYDVKPPTEDEIRGAFTLRYELAPVPDVRHYSCNDHALEKLLKRQFEENLESAYRQAERDAVIRLAEPIDHLIERLIEYEKREDRKERGMIVDKTGTFKGTVISNINEVAKTFRSFNLVGNPLLDQVATRIEAFAAVDVEDLKTDANLRKETAEKANAIRQLLGNWLD